MNAAQCRMARAALEVGVRELAIMAKVSPTTISKLENGDALKPRTIEAIKSTLEGMGIEFINRDGAGFGVLFTAGK